MIIERILYMLSKQATQKKGGINHGKQIAAGGANILMFLTYLIRFDKNEPVIQK